MVFYAIIFLVFFSSLILLLLVVRFVQPELIYSVRHALIQVRSTKVFRDAFAKRFTESKVFPELLGDDLRYETRDYDEEYVLQRVNKIRKLYRVLSRRPLPGNSNDRKPQVCIVELAGLLNNIARHTKPDRKFHYATTDASLILRLIANELRKKKDLSELKDAKDVEDWFTANPISIEQVIEILIAAVFSLAYRQRVQVASDAEDGEEQEAAKESGGDEDESAYENIIGSPFGISIVHRQGAATQPVNASPDEAGASAVEPTADDTAPPARDAASAGASTDGRAVRVFVSYSHRDAKYLSDESLLGTLKGLESEGVEFWSDQSITAGDKWDEEIKARIAGSHIVLVLVSQAFLDSPYCQNVEIRRFLTEAEQQRGLVIMPVMLSACEWARHDWLSSRQFLPSGSKTVEEHFAVKGKRKQLFLEIRTHLRRQIDGIRRFRRPRIG